VTGPPTADAWRPDQYHRFAAERTAPARDLLALLQPAPGARAVDLGCGTGELTVELHRRLGATETIGVDRSASMLEQANPRAGEGVRFQAGDLRDVGGLGSCDVVFANASLQWVPDHRSVLTAWTGQLNAGGQLAVQVPANVDHASHLTSAEVAAEHPFVNAFDDGVPPPDPVRDVLKPEQYAELLDELGYTEQHVRLQVYGHHLASTADVVEWVKGTSLVRFRERMPAELYEQFLDTYRTRLLQVLGDRSPYFYAFKRILLWARRP
jgi:trans-aconitate 2-methyltransferase